MIQVQARFELTAQGTFEIADRLVTQIMDVLMLDDTILQPDAYVSMTEGEFGRIGIDMLINTDLPHVAFQLGSQALSLAFQAAAGQTPRLEPQPFGVLAPNADYRTERVLASA